MSQRQGQPGQARPDLPSQIHQIMDQLEQKTELLFKLKKERQAVIEEEVSSAPASYK